MLLPRQQRSNLIVTMESRMIEQTASELQLHRMLYVIKLLRAVVLHLLLTLIATLLYFLTGIHNAYPVATAFIQALHATAISIRIQGNPAGTVGFAICLAVLILAALALLVWTYRSITNVRRSALRFQGLVILSTSLWNFYATWPNLTFAFQNLNLLFAVLAAFGAAIPLVVLPVSVSLALWKVSHLQESSSLLATLDPRLAPTFWVYWTKLLDLPRTPLRTPRTAAAFLLALTGSVLMIASIFNLITVGGAGNKLVALEVFSKHDMIQEAIAASFVEARRIAWLLPCAFLGVKLAALLQSTAKKFGGLSVSDVIKSSTDRFVLYLRPFDLDDVILPKPRLSLGNRLLSLRPYPVRIEEELFDVADGYRPLIAVGKPGTAGAAHGGEAYRAYLDNSEWQGYVAERIQRADRIVMVIEQTEGVRWEIERILAEGAVRKTLFFFHPKVRDLKDWETVEPMIIPILQRAGLVPQDFAFQSRPIGFYFQGDALIEIVNANWSATSYRTAFSHFLAESGG
jgi:hypothetical protein